jgi:hypothetical protein
MIDPNTLNHQLEVTERQELVRRFYRLIREPGAVCEVRITNPLDRFSGTISGYFDDEEAFVRAIEPYLSKHFAEAVYATINPVPAALLARSPNRLAVRAKTTTSDRDVVRRDFFYIDVDPVRPAGISATDTERKAALDATLVIAQYLAEHWGWPTPALIGSSGNGGTLLYRIDLPNDAVSTRLLGKVLEHLASLFNSPAVTIDTTLINAARLVKIPGTVAAKGHPLPDRPYRIAVAEIDHHASTVTREQLERLVGGEETIEPEDAPEHGQDASGAEAALHDVEAALQAKGIGYTVKSCGYATVVNLDRCLTSTAHTDGASILVFPSGARAYKCHHDSCKEKTWADVAALLGFAETGPEDSSTSPPRDKARPQAMTGTDLLRQVFTPVRYVVNNRLTEGLYVFAGAPKVGKSWAMLDAALALSGGGTWLGEPVTTPGDVLYLALEDNPRRLRSRLEQLLFGKPPTEPMPPITDDFVIDFADLPPLPDRVTFWTESPRLDEGGLTQIEAWLKAHPEAVMVIIDTLAKVRPKTAKNNSAYDSDYAALTGLQRLAAKYKVAIVVVHHLRKMSSEDPLERISGTMGISGAADGIYVLERQRGTSGATLFMTGRDLEHELNLALEFDPVAARWHVLGDADELRRSREQQEIIDVLREAGEPLSPAHVAERLEQPRNRIKQRIFQMAKRGQLVSNDGKYRLA